MHPCVKPGARQVEGMSGFQRVSAIIACKRFFVTFQLCQNVATIEMNVGHAALERDGPVVIGKRLVVPAEIAEHVTAVSPGFSEIGRDRNGRSSSPSFVVAPHVAQDIASVRVRLGELRCERDCTLIARKRLAYRRSARSALPRLQWARAWSGLIRNVHSKLSSASSVRSSSVSTLPRLYQHSACSGLTFSARRNFQSIRQPAECPKRISAVEVSFRRFRLEP